MLTANEKDILIAAFAKHSGAWDAFCRWNEGVDWNREISTDFVSVLPAVCHNLRGLGYVHPLFPRFLGIDRKVWVENQAVKKNLMEWLPDVEKAMLLALPPTAYLFSKDLRYPLHRSHLSFAVYSASEAVQVIRALLAKGWIPKDGLILPRRWLDGVVWGMDHLGMHRGNGEWLSLTWRMGTWFGSRWEETWRNTERVHLGGIALRVLGATESMEFLLRQPISGRPFRRLVQVLMMNSENLDWDKLQNAFLNIPLQSDAMRLARLVREISGAPILSKAVQSKIETRLADRSNEKLREEPFSPGNANSRGLWPLMRLQLAWRRYCDTWPNGVVLTRAIAQLPGYVMGRWFLHLQKRRRLKTDE